MLLVSPPSRVRAYGARRVQPSPNRSARRPLTAIWRPSCWSGDSNTRPLKVSEDHVALLIALLGDRAERPDVREDAADYLSESDDDRALMALVEVGSRADDDEFIVGAAGEGLANAAIRRHIFDAKWLSQLHPAALNELIPWVKADAPDLLE